MQKSTGNFNISAWFQTWVKALTKPSEQTYSELIRQPDSSAQTAYIWMAVAGAISGLIALIRHGSVFGILLTAVYAVLGLMVDAWVVNLFATKVFKGKGNLSDLLYAFAAFAAPILVVNAILALIPVIGSILSVLLSLFTLVLSVFATQAVYKLTTGKAAGSVLIPAAIIIVIVMIIVVFFLVIFGGVIGGVFSNVLKSLGK